MKAFEIVSEATLWTSPTTSIQVPGPGSTNAPSSTVSTPKTTARVPGVYDPNTPTRNQLSRGQVRQMARTGKVTVGGKTFTKDAILRNTSLNKARLNKLAKGGGNVGKGAKADLKQLMKKHSGIFAKGSPQATPTKLPATDIIGKIKNGPPKWFGWVAALAAQGYITYEQIAADIADYNYYYQKNGCTMAKGPYSSKMEEQRQAVNKHLVLGLVEFFSAIAGGAVAVGILTKFFAAVPGLGWIAFVVGGLGAMAVGQLAWSLSKNSKLLDKVAENTTGHIFTHAMMQDLSGGNIACATESINEEQKPISTEKAKAEIHSIVKQDKNLMKLIAMAKKAKKSD